jgi:N,N'-diacetyllegionaminate synthase
MLIAEIGLNHLGSFTRANDYVARLVKSNIDGITFQVREPTYYEQSNKNNLLLTDNDYINLCNKIKSHNKKFGIAIADINKIDFFESIDTDFYKVIRNDITNKKLIKKLIKTKKELIVSTGVSSKQEIQEFLQEFGNENITLNHTQLSYDVKDCNLKAIKTLQEQYPTIPISYGSHCSNENVLYMSLCYNPYNILFYVKGAELHVNVNYPDDKHAIMIRDIDKIVNNLKSLKYAIGSGIKEKTEIKIK